MFIILLDILLSTNCIMGYYMEVGMLVRYQLAVLLLPLFVCQAGSQSFYISVSVFVQTVHSVSFAMTCVRVHVIRFFGFCALSSWVFFICLFYFFFVSPPSISLFLTLTTLVGCDCCCCYCYNDFFMVLVLCLCVCVCSSNTLIQIHLMTEQNARALKT